MNVVRTQPSKYDRVPSNRASAMNSGAMASRIHSTSLAKISMAMQIAKNSVAATHTTAAMIHGPGAVRPPLLAIAPIASPEAFHMSERAWPGPVANEVAVEPLISRIRSVPRSSGTSDAQL